MVTNKSFNGLSMPVFTAFGWAGEENAINFALSQMELFINSLQASLPREAQSIFPYWGIDKEANVAYIAAEEQPEEGLYISMAARPLSLEINLSLKDKASLKKAYKMITADLDAFFKLLNDLGLDWQIHLQQVEYDPDAEETTFYQDLLKSKIGELNLEETVHIIARAEYLNEEDKWVIPLNIFRRSESEKISSMGYKIIDHMVGQISSLIPLAQFISGKKRRKKRKPSDKPKQKSVGDVEETAIRQPADSAELEKFVYVSHLLPLHIRRGFINLTPKHWPFFGLNARSETRLATLKFGDQIDDECTVWRLSPNDQARLVVSSKAQHWLELNFEPNDSIQVTAVKLSDKKIEIALEPIS